MAGHMPGYHGYADTMSSRAYFERAMEQAIYDTVLTVRLANGFTMHGVIPDYFPQVQGRGHLRRT